MYDTFKKLTELCKDYGYKVSISYTPWGHFGDIFHIETFDFDTYKRFTVSFGYYEMQKALESKENFNALCKKVEEEIDKFRRTH